MATVIAIDGPSASGKGTIARKLAAHLDFAYLDTGLLYRAVGMAVLRAGADPADPVLAEKEARALNATTLMQSNDEELRSDTASVAASKVAAIPAVREALLKFQKDFCAHPPENRTGAVLDGRDIGTVIAPDAKVKIFVTASAEIRADRRFKELQSRGITTSYGDVLADMQARDARDAARAIAPTRPAPDAVLLDTDNLNAQQALDAAIKIVENKL